MLLPFFILSIGIFLGFIFKNTKISSYSDKFSSYSILFLMLSIGIGIGINPSIIRNFGRIGFNCIIISFFAIVVSILTCFFYEKFVFSLNKLQTELEKQSIFSTISNSETSKSGDNHFVIFMPIIVFLGIVLGLFFSKIFSNVIIDRLITIFLMSLFLCVGISLGNDIGIFKYLKSLGIKLLFFSFFSVFGSFLGGAISGIILNIPIKVSTLSACGMGYYSLTGGYMSEVLGVEYGTYGFIVNIIRELSTVLFLPIFLKIGATASIACGGATTMDTMLMPISKASGPAIGVIAFFNGVILTFIIPFLLPVINYIFN